MKADAFSLFSLALPLLACAVGPKPAAVHYPSLPNPAGVAPAEASFEPAASLTSLPLDCRAAELPLANALDDDCNGRIDDALPGAPAADESVVLAVAFPQTAKLTLALQTGANPPLDLTPVECPAASAFCTRLVAGRELTRGDSVLRVDGASLDPAAPPPSVVVSLQLRGKVSTYVTPVTIGVPGQVLGKLFLP